MNRAVAIACLFTVIAAAPLAAQQRDGQRQQFQQIFRLPGIEFTEQQQAQADDLRKKFTPQLLEIQQKRGAVYTQEQRQARREAQQAARDKGLRGRELAAALAKAMKLSDDQQKELDALQKKQAEIQQTVQSELRGLLTAQQRQQLQRQAGRNAPGNRGPAIAATHRNLKYGPHDRNVMDVWLAETDKSAPVLVSIHGGGFRGGNKGVDRNLLKGCLDAGISVVAITYRLSGEAIAPAQFLDSARAIQFIRHNAKEWNLDGSRIASTGGSAGAGLSLWLGMHDDLADPDNEDPVLRQSTRLTCMSVYNGQTSYDPRFIRDLFPGTDTYKHPALAQLYDVDLDRLDDLPKAKYELFEKVSSLNHLSKDDVPVQLTYASKIDTAISSQGVGIHHPKFGYALKEKMDKLGIECEVHTGSQRGSEEWVKLTLDFVKKHFAK